MKRAIRWVCWWAEFALQFMIMIIDAARHPEAWADPDGYDQVQADKESRND